MLIYCPMWSLVSVSLEAQSGASGLVPRLVLGQVVRPHEGLLTVTADEPLHAGVSSLVAGELIAPGEGLLTVREGTAERPLSCVDSTVSLEVGEFEVWRDSSENVKYFSELTRLATGAVPAPVGLAAGLLLWTLDTGTGRGRGEPDDQLGSSLRPPALPGLDRGVSDDRGLPRQVVVDQRHLADHIITGPAERELQTFDRIGLFFSSNLIVKWAWAGTVLDSSTSTILSSPSSSSEYPESSSFLAPLLARSPAMILAWSLFLRNISTVVSCKSGQSLNVHNAGEGRSSSETDLLS